MTDVAPPAATAARAILGALVRSLLKIAGTALVTRGVIDQGTVDGTLPMLVETLVGAIMVSGASSWSVVRAFAAHTRWAKAWAALRADRA